MKKTVKALTAFLNKEAVRIKRCMDKGQQSKKRIQGTYDDLRKSNAPYVPVKSKN